MPSLPANLPQPFSDLGWAQWDITEVSLWPHIYHEMLSEPLCWSPGWSVESEDDGKGKVKHSYAVTYLIKMLLYYRDLGFILVFLNLFCSFFLPPASPSLLSNPHPSSLLSIFRVTWHLLPSPLSHISFAPPGFPIKSHSHTHSLHPCPMYTRTLKGWI